MKAFVCELCGSNDIVKRGEEFVCEACGTKYGVEEARRMMVEGKVDVSGSQVKLDNSDRIKNLYDVARRSRDQGNSEQAAHYYGQIAAELPNDWEAAFFSVYYQSMQTKIANIETAANRVTNCLSSTVSLINQQFETAAEKQKALTTVSIYVFHIGKALASSAQKHYDGIGDSVRNKYTHECCNRIKAAAKIPLKLGTLIASQYTDAAFKALAVNAWKAGIDILETHNSMFENKGISVIGGYAKLIHPYDPAYAEPYLRKYYDYIKQELYKASGNNKKEKTTVTIISGIIAIGLFLLAAFVLADISMVLGVIAYIVAGFFLLACLGGIAEPKPSPQAAEELKEKIQLLEKEKTACEKLLGIESEGTNS